MSIEIPKNEPEEIKSVEEAEGVIELTPEEIAELIDQIPDFKKVLQERETQLSELEKDPNIDPQAIESLRIEIEEIKQNIADREELPSN